MPIRSAGTYFAKSLQKLQLLIPRSQVSNPSGGAGKSAACRIHELLLEAMADDLNEPQDALRPRLVAAAAVAALTSLEGSFDEKAGQHAGGQG